MHDGGCLALLGFARGGAVVELVLVAAAAVLVVSCLLPAMSVALCLNQQSC